MAREAAYPWKYAAYVATYYVANAAYQGYITKYYTSKGVDNAQLSVLMAAVAVVSVAMQPVWGAIGDRMKSRNTTLRVMTALSAALIAAFSYVSGFWQFLPMVCLFSACYTPIQPMGDSIVLENLDRRKMPFGPLRLTGCLSYAVFNLVLGYLLGDRYHVVPWLTAGLMTILFFTSYSLPPTEGHQSKGSKMRFSALFKNKPLMVMLGLLMLLQLTMGYFYSFFTVHFLDMPGASSTLLGVCYFTSAVSEVAFLLNADKLFEKVGAGRLMCVSALALTIRWVILGLTSNPYVALASQVLHGGGFIVMTVSTSKYVSRTVPDELKASGQMLLSVVGFGVARVFGILGGGLLSDALGGTRQSFLVMACVTLVALIVYTPYYFRRAPLNGLAPQTTEGTKS